MKSSKEFLLDGDDGDVGSATDGRQRQRTRTDGGSAAALPFHERVNQSGEVVEVRRARERAPRPELITPLRNDGAARARARGGVNGGWREGRPGRADPLRVRRRLVALTALSFISFFPSSLLLHSLPSSLSLLRSGDGGYYRLPPIPN